MQMLTIVQFALWSRQLANKHEVEFLIWSTWQQVQGSDCEYALRCLYLELVAGCIV